MKIPHYTEITVKRNWYRPKVKVGFLFDLYAWHLLWQDEKIQLQDIGSQKPDQLISMMLFNAARSYSKDSGEKVWYTQQMIEGWLDLLTRKEFSRLTEVFQESFTDIQKTSDIAGKGEKKK